MNVVLTSLLILIHCASCASAPVADRTKPAASLDGPTAMTDKYSFNDCEGEIDRENHTLSCPGFVLSRTTIEQDDDWTTDLLMKMTLATLREGAETVGKTAHRRVDPNLSVDGGLGYAMTLTTQNELGEQTMAMTTFARPLENGDVVGVMCLDLESLNPGRCEELSPWFAVNLPDLAWVDVSKPTQFAGRMINAPPGCTLDDENMIICAGTGSELLWYEQEPDDAPGTYLTELNVVHEAIVRVNRESTRTEPKKTVQGFDCHIDGEVGDCKLYSYTFRGDTLYVLVGVGVVRGIELGVLCDWSADLTDEVPVPCSLVVDPNPADGTREL